MPTARAPDLDLRSHRQPSFGKSHLMNPRPFVVSGSRGAARLAAVLSLGVLLAGCEMLKPKPEPVAQVPEPPPPPQILEPVATHQFELGPDDDVIGQLQVTKIEGEDTFSDIARRFNVGYEEMVRANPGIDPWVPGVGREVVVPTQFVLPNAPREGLVINLAQLRVYYFPKVKEGEPQKVITHPIGVGKVGWSTPEGVTKVTGKAKNPTWYPPASVRKEHREAGDPLPSKVPAGPDNPLGHRMMTLGWPSYLVHGTNKPYGVGMRSSHGCIRFYPEDIEQLYDAVPVGTKVTVVNQPFVFGWHNGALYVQAFPIAEDDEREHPSGADALLNAAISDRMWQAVTQHNVSIDLELVNQLADNPRGIAVPVSRPTMRAEATTKKGRKQQQQVQPQPSLTLEQYIASARHVENRVPEGANWNGKDELIVEAADTIKPKTKSTKKAPAATEASTMKPTAQTTRPSSGPTSRGGRRGPQVEAEST